MTTYGSCLQNFALYYRRELQKPGPYVARLHENDLKAFIDHIQYDRRLSASSVNRYITALCAFSSFILLKRWHRRLLSRGLKRYRIDTNSPPASLSRREVRRMISAVDEKSRNGPRNLALLQLMLQCGLRVGEIVRLSRDDVTIHQTVGRLRVRAAKPEQEHHPTEYRRSPGAPGPFGCTTSRGWFRPLIYLGTRKSNGRRSRAVPV